MFITLSLRLQSHIISSCRDFFPSFSQLLSTILWSISKLSSSTLSRISNNTYSSNDDDDSLSLGHYILQPNILQVFSLCIQSILNQVVYIQYKYANRFILSKVNKKDTPAYYRTTQASDGTAGTSIYLQSHHL